MLRSFQLQIQMLAFASGRINIKIINIANAPEVNTYLWWFFVIGACLRVFRMQIFCVGLSLASNNLPFEKGVNDAVRSPSPAEGDERVANCD